MAGMLHDAIRARRALVQEEAQYPRREAKIQTRRHSGRETAETIKNVHKLEISNATSSSQKGSHNSVETTKAVTNGNILITQYVFVAEQHFRCSL